MAVAFENPKGEMTGVANSDLTTKQHFALKLVPGDRRVDICGVDASLFWGIQQNKPLGIGQDVTVARGGISKAIAGAAIVAPARVKPDANGRLIPAVAGDQYVGVALRGATALGDVISVDLDQKGRIPA